MLDRFLRLMSDTGDDTRSDRSDSEAKTHLVHESLDYTN